ncbi:MAG: hypothetical protein KUG62_08465, partial [Rhodobacteraceae bacterium]|nr:hypothetical protein [Paracoccaceae bacterium]
RTGWVRQSLPRRRMMDDGLYSLGSIKRSFIRRAASNTMGSLLPFAAFAYKFSVETGYERRHSGLSGLVLVRLLLMQHLLAIATARIWLCSIFHQSRRSN